MKLAALLACGACLVFFGCSDSGATSAIIEDDANIPIEGDALGDSPSGDSTGDSMMATDTGMAADTGKTDTGSTGDTGGGAKIACGSSSCDAATQVCCAGTAGTSCNAKGGTCPATEFKYSCTQPSDCTGGQVCCAAATGGASCAASCPGTTVCSSNTDCKGALKNCKPIPGVSSIKVCSA